MEKTKKNSKKTVKNWQNSQKKAKKTSKSWNLNPQKTNLDFLNGPFKTLDSSFGVFQFSLHLFNLVRVVSDGLFEWIYIFPK
jgi:hypothetical protein